MASSAPWPLTGLAIKSFADLLALPDVPMQTLQRMRKQQQQQQQHRDDQPTAAAADCSGGGRVLISHDFKGNFRPSDYATFSLPPGSPASATTNTTPSPHHYMLCPGDECFTMEHEAWAVCDFFNYFSHNRVSIPPPEWVAATRKQQQQQQHQNKNRTTTPPPRILGTVITEWDEGARECDYLLEDERRMNRIVLKLATLCLVHNFDGYLVNIENPVRNVQRMRQFVQMLHDTIKGMLGGIGDGHNNQDGEQQRRGYVLWYDSVVSTGALRWQNTLNKHNEMFYEVCDGIFTNYQWDLDAACEAIDTIERLNDKNKNSNKKGKIFSSPSVFMGTDCFGRGTHLGGGFDSHKAVEEALSVGMSAAIFAPGWTMENFPHHEEVVEPKRRGTTNANDDCAADDVARCEMDNSEFARIRRSYVKVSSRFWHDIACAAAVKKNQTSPRVLCKSTLLPTTASLSSSSCCCSLISPIVATSFCASAGCIFALFGCSRLSTNYWCQQSAVDPELQPATAEPCAGDQQKTTSTRVVIAAVHDNRDSGVELSSSAVVGTPIIQEHFCVETAAACGCFWGNRTWRCVLPVCAAAAAAADESAQNRRNVKLCSFVCVDNNHNNISSRKEDDDAAAIGSSEQLVVVFELVVPPTLPTSLRERGADLLLELEFPEILLNNTSGSDTDNKKTILSGKFTHQHPPSPLLNKNNDVSVLRCEVPVALHKMLQQKSPQKVDDRGVLCNASLRVASDDSSSSTSSTVPIDVGYLRAFCTTSCGAAAAGRPLVSIMSKKATVTTTEEHHWLSIKKRCALVKQQRDAKEEQPVEVLQLALSEEKLENILSGGGCDLSSGEDDATDSHSKMMPDSIAVVRTTATKNSVVVPTFFCGYVFVAGVALVCEVPAGSVVAQQDDDDDDEGEKNGWGVVLRFADGSFEVCL